TVTPEVKGVRAFAIADDRKQLLTASKDGEILFWDLETGAQVEGKSLDIKTDFGVTPSGWRPKIHMAYNAKSQRLAVTATPDQGSTHTAVWDMKKNAALPISKKSPQALSALNFTPDGKRLIMALIDYTLETWNLETDKRVRTESGHEGHIEAMDISPDGKRLATASDDETIRVFDIASWHELVSLGGHERSVISISFSSDGRKLASVAEDQSLLVRHVFPDVHSLKEHICLEFKHINVTPKIDRKFPNEPEMKLDALCANSKIGG
ncbi:MAG: hypothetical protein HKN05_14870, partial [Rhizobiales bacterium]|nr:hypothetical protein [Hyphomicrobiales bacterium]